MVKNSFRMRINPYFKKWWDSETNPKKNGETQGLPEPTKMAILGPQLTKPNPHVTGTKLPSAIYRGLVDTNGKLISQEVRING